MARFYQHLALSRLIVLATHLGRSKGLCWKDFNNWTCYTTWTYYTTFTLSCYNILNYLLVLPFSCLLTGRVFVSYGYNGFLVGATRKQNHPINRANTMVCWPRRSYYPITFKSSFLEKSSRLVFLSESKYEKKEIMKNRNKWRRA